MVEANGRAEQSSDNVRWQPICYQMDHSDDFRAVATLQQSALVTVNDTVLEQLEDLIAARHPSRDLSREEIEGLVRHHLGAVAPADYGCWIFYPWSRRLVHLLPKSEFQELRSNRNCFSITPADQAQLRSRRVGVVGLSAGQWVAINLALEGIGGSFRIADFDLLCLSNLNRLRSGVHNLGLNKAVIAAREILEIDPYVEVLPFLHGLDDSTIDAFLLEGGKLDLVVEECDDLYLKVRLRERARDLAIPVLMATSDRGLLDVERFDLERDRPLFHGLVQGLDASRLRGLSAKEKLPFALGILGDQLSPTGAASLVEIKERIATWPQLASAVALGGAMVTDVARRILLGSFSDSGRYTIDLESSICDASRGLTQESNTLYQAPCPPAVSPPELPSPPARMTSKRITADEVRYAVAHAILAPSGGNSQPWAFRFDGSRLFCFLDEERSQSFLNFRNFASYVALGAAIENLTLACGSLGLQAEISLLPDGTASNLVCSVSFDRTRNLRRSQKLCESIASRVTNRKAMQPRPIPLDELQRWRDEVGADGIQFITERDALEELGSILGRIDRCRFLNREMHRELMGELRWTAEEVLATRDGLDIATLELSAADVAVLKLLRSWEVIDRIGKNGGGAALERATREKMMGTPAVALLTWPGTDEASYFEGGRALQRLWLGATRSGLAIQPQGVAPYLFARLENGRTEGFSNGQAEELATLRTRYRTLFGIRENVAEILLLRIGYADLVQARSLRRPVANVLAFAEDSARLERH